MDSQKTANWAQILSLPAGYFCAYASWVLLHPTSSASPPAQQRAVWSVLTPATLWVAFGVFGGFAVLGTVLSVGSWLSRKHATRETMAPQVPIAAPQSSLPYPTVRVFRHKEARKHNDNVFHQIRELFANAGWRVEEGNTDLPKHESGIRIAGTASYETEAAKWALNNLGIEWMPDERENPPEVLEVIVGRYEPAKSEPAPTPTDLSAFTHERDQLRKALEDTQQDREKLRGVLSAEIQQTRGERDGMEQAWLMCKREFALARLRWFAERVEMNIAKSREGGRDVSDVNVTIRFASYQEDDHAIVAQVEEILRSNTKWRINPLDGSNNPALRPHDEFKVVFVSNLAGNFGEVHAAFQEGLLIKGLRADQIARRENLDSVDGPHLIIEVLPTMKKK